MIKKKLSYTKLIALSFLLIIAVGTLLLMLPLATRAEGSASFSDALFTATSATCVTGLIIADTFTRWTLFGQIVIILLIQIGGLGFMTVITLFSMLFGRKINLGERRLLMQSVGSTEVSGIVRLIKRILVGTFLFEFIGALLLSIRFIPEYGVSRGIYFSIFHSVSSFCNAGFDLMGFNTPYSSFTAYSADWLVCSVLMALIIIGGIGFIVWNDIYSWGFRFSKYTLHSKIVLTATLAFVFIPAVYFFFSESNSSLAGMDFGERLLSSLFLSISPRTAGFNSVDLTALSEGSFTLECFLMLIGGNPGSTAGGIKTVTVVVLLLRVVSTVKSKKDITIFKRSLEPTALHTACTILIIYISALLASIMAITLWEPVGIRELTFQTISAIGTVGLSIGDISSYRIATQMILAVLMFLGRVGGLSLVLVLAERKQIDSLSRPSEKILIG